VVLLLAMLAAQPATARADEGQSHTVQPGETLRRIADHYGVTVEALAAENSLVNPNVIYAGQVLIIPQGAGDHVDDSGSDTTEENKTSVGGRDVVHVVQPGETLTRIAVHYGVSTETILQRNRLSNPNLIFAGQRLQIAGASAEAEFEEMAVTPVKQIVVDKSQQRAYVYENGELIWTFVISTGMPGSETWEGTFAVRSKILNAYAQLWGLQMPYWVGFYHTGYLENGFHALPIMPSGAVLWDGYLGTPVSYGCVILSNEDAATLYEWAEIGTEVVVQP
jgi:LysM repeat protein